MLMNSQFHYSQIHNYFTIDNTFNMMTNLFMLHSLTYSSLSSLYIPYYPTDYISSMSSLIIPLSLLLMSSILYMCLVLFTLVSLPLSLHIMCLDSSLSIYILDLYLSQISLLSFHSLPLYLISQITILSHSILILSPSLFIILYILIILAPSLSLDSPYLILSFMSLFILYFTIHPYTLHTLLSLIIMYYIISHYSTLILVPFTSHIPPIHSNSLHHN